VASVRTKPQIQPDSDTWGTISTDKATDEPMRGSFELGVATHKATNSEASGRSPVEIRLRYR
jgi:hypothetical protein